MPTHRRPLGLFCYLTCLLVCAGCSTHQKAASESSRTTPLFSFGVIADIQYCDCNTSGSRHYRSSLGKLKDAVEVFNTEPLAFVVQLGDLIDRDVASFDTVLALYNELQAPAYHVVGNHEFAIIPGMKPRVRREVLGLQQGYYSFKHASWRFVVLDGNDVSLLATARASEKHRQARQLVDTLAGLGAPNAQTWNGALGAEQMEWLRATLTQADDAGEQVMLFCHFPVYPKDVHTLWNDDEVIALLSKHKGVKAYLNGHNHSGNYASHEGIHYLTLRGMVETAAESAYTIIEVYPDHLSVRGHGREEDRRLILR